MARPAYDTVTRVIPAPPGAIFAILADPARHPALDDSGMVLSLVSGGPLTRDGQVFTMAMSMGPGSDYRTDNHVFDFVSDRSIGWRVARDGGEALGWSWHFALEPTAAGTRVSQTYDWSAASKAVRDTIPFPAIPREAREETLVLLEELVTT